VCNSFNHDSFKKTQIENKDKTRKQGENSMVKPHVFIGMCILLLLIMNSSALEYPTIYLENGEEIVNLSQYSNIELNDEEKAEIREKQRSFIVLVGMMISIFTIFCLTLLIGLYVSEKRKGKSEKK